MRKIFRRRKAGAGMQDQGERRNGNGGEAEGRSDGQGPGPGSAPGQAPGAAPAPGQAPGAAPGPAPAQLPLFYKTPEPLQEARFAGKGLRKDGGFGFAAKAHAVALHLQEFRFAAAHYPIVFADDTAAMPLAVLGYREGENLFVGAEGHWAEGAYVPAYVRRYPFVIGQGPKPDAPILYLDRDSDLLVDLAQEPEADPLFAEDGGASERVKQALAFCAAFQQQVPLTQAFVAAVEKHDLLETKEIRLELPGGKPQVLTGLRLIDEAKFNALSDEVFLEWRKNAWVAAVYWHWASMDNFRRMVARAAPTR